MKHIRSLLSWLLMLSLAAVLGLLGFVRSTVPGDPNVLKAAVRQPVQIYYDQFKTPFVQAQSWQDAYLAQGWLHAHNRLWQMELFRRAGKGRLAEVLGSGLLETDMNMFRAGVPMLAERLAANASEELRGFVAAYVAGINLALSGEEGEEGENATPLPPEFRLAGFRPEPWQAADVYALGALMAFQSGNNYRNELLRLALTSRLQEQLAGASAAELSRWLSILGPVDARMPAFPYVLKSPALLGLLAQTDHLEPQLQPLLAAPGLGSNGWVVSPDRTAEGHALFAFDSHDALSMPNLTYDVHLFVGQEQIRGASVPGLPGVINGFNEFMAWGFTNTGDSQDLFIEQRSSESDLHFIGPTGIYEAQAVEVLIPVQGQSPHPLRVVTTQNGRLLSEEPPLALRWSALEVPQASLDALLALNRATSYPRFSAALDTFVAPSANATYADVTGRIAFRTVGALPMRGAGEGLLPLPGHLAENVWQGLIPVDDLPRVVNPSEGFVAAANARIAPGPPLISADNSPGYRIARIQSELRRNASATFADMQALQVDWFNVQAQRLLPAMLAAVDGIRLEPEVMQGVTSLASWVLQPVNLPELSQPLLFDAWYRQLGLLVFSPILGDELTRRLMGSAYVFNHALDGLLTNSMDSPWWQGERQQLITQALINAVNEVGRAQSWQDQHQVLLTHELSAAVPGLGWLLNDGPHAWGGGNPTVGRARYNYNQPYIATGGATARLVIAMEQPMRAATISPGGQSGHFMSVHYDDQTPLWLAGELNVLATRPQQLGSPTTTLIPIEESPHATTVD
ncbi:MAG: penicillin acylase family protein [bacterium]